MKTVFFILLIVSFNSLAGYVAESKINSCQRTSYSSPSGCQESEGEACYRVPNDSGDCGIFKLKEIFGSVKFDQESCSGQIECQELLMVKVCGVDRYPLIDESYSEVYCVEVVEKELVIDEQVKAQKDAEKALEMDRESKIQAEIKKMDCGKRVKAVLKIENDKRSLPANKKKAQADTYGNIANYLDNGSLDVAKIEIDKIVPDGDIVLASDLEAVKEELLKCPQ